MCITYLKSVPKLPSETSFRRFFFRPTHPGKKRRTVADTFRQDKRIKTLATNTPICPANAPSCFRKHASPREVKNLSNAALSSVSLEKKKYKNQMQASIFKSL